MYDLGFALHFVSVLRLHVPVVRYQEATRQFLTLLHSSFHLQMWRRE